MNECYLGGLLWVIHDPLFKLLEKSLDLWTSVLVSAVGGQCSIASNSKSFNDAGNGMKFPEEESLIQHLRQKTDSHPSIVGLLNHSSSVDLIACGVINIDSEGNDSSQVEGLEKLEVRRVDTRVNVLMTDLSNLPVVWILNNIIRVPRVKRESLFHFLEDLLMRISRHQMKLSPCQKKGPLFKGFV